MSKPKRVNNIEQTAAASLLSLGQESGESSPILPPRPNAFAVFPNTEHPCFPPDVPTHQHHQHRGGYMLPPPSNAQRQTLVNRPMMMPPQHPSRVGMRHHPSVFQPPPSRHQRHFVAPRGLHAPRQTTHLPETSLRNTVEEQEEIEKTRAAAVSPVSVHTEGSAGERKPPHQLSSPENSPRMENQDANEASSNSNNEDDDKEITPGVFDVLIGTGRTCSAHPGNRRFHKEIYEQCMDYFEADYKKGVVDRAIRAVHRRGGRFLCRKGDGWEVVTDHDRLERNTRKSFHMAKKQREAQVERMREEQASSSPSRHHHHQHKPSYVAPSSSSSSEPHPLRTHVAVYRGSVGAYCIGTIEAQANGLSLLRFDDHRLGSEWVDLNKADCRVFSM